MLLKFSANLKNPLPKLEKWDSNRLVPPLTPKNSKTLLKFSVNLINPVLKLEKWDSLKPDLINMATLKKMYMNNSEMIKILLNYLKNTPKPTKCTSWKKLPLGKKPWKTKNWKNGIKITPITRNLPKLNKKKKTIGKKSGMPEIRWTESMTD